MYRVAQTQLVAETLMKLPPGNYSQIAIRTEGTNNAGQTFTADDIKEIIIRSTDSKFKPIVISGKRLKLYNEHTRGAHTGASIAASAFYNTLFIPSARPREDNARAVIDEMYVDVRVDQSVLTAKVSGVTGKVSLFVENTLSAANYQLCLREIDLDISSANTWKKCEMGDVSKIMGLFIDANTATITDVKYSDSRGEILNCRIEDINADSNYSNEIETVVTATQFYDLDKARNPLNTIARNPSLEYYATVAGLVKTVVVYQAADEGATLRSQNKAAQFVKQEIVARGVNNPTLNRVARAAGYKDAAEMAARLGA